LTDRATPLPATAASGRVFLPLAGGQVSCLELKTGALLWSSELGGQITSSLALGKDVVIVSTSASLETNPRGSLRALDAETGLTRWAADYDRPFAGPILVEGDRLYCGNSDGSLYALSSKDGAVAWKAATQDVVRGSVLACGATLYFGSDDGAVRGVEASTGKETFKFQTRGRIRGGPSARDDTVYFGSGDGYTYAVELSGRLKWKSRTGAAVEASVLIAGERLIVGSLDNFVYALSLASGDRLWKRRLDGRITDDPVVKGDLTMVASSRGATVHIFLNSDGRLVNSLHLETGYEIVARPTHAEGRLLVPTDRGLVVAAAHQPGAARPRRVRERPQ
jgi:outer membrane protein assembly factor BamB